MVRLAIYLLQALDLALVIWGQQTFPPDVVTFPPPPTMTSVINDSLVLFVGEPIVVGEDVRVTIDCSEVIDPVIAGGISNPTIRWIKDGAELTVNGSAPNVDISADRRRLIITNTLLPVGGQVGNDGNYTCEVCDDSTDVNCRNRTTCNAVCGFPNIMVPSADPVVNLFLISMSCGQDATVDSLATVGAIVINCQAYNGTEPFIQEVYKDGELIQNGTSLSLVISPVSDDDFGTYTFALSTEKCGTAAAVSRIYQAIVIETGESAPPSVENGVITVNVGSTVYTVNGFTIIIICNVINGEPPITISWFRNEQLDQSRGNVSTITITDGLQGDVFTCRAENRRGCTQQDTRIQLANNSTFCIAAT